MPLLISLLGVIMFQCLFIGWSRKTDLEWEDRFSAGVYRL